jgi:hypothetical protein
MNNEQLIMKNGEWGMNDGEWTKAVKYFSRSFVCIGMGYRGWGVTVVNPLGGFTS